MGFIATLVAGLFFAILGFIAREKPREESKGSPAPGRK